MPKEVKPKYRVVLVLPSQEEGTNCKALSDPMPFFDAEQTRGYYENLGYQATLQEVVPEKKKKKVNWKLLQAALPGLVAPEEEIHGSN